MAVCNDRGRESKPILLHFRSCSGNYIHLSRGLPTLKSSLRQKFRGSLFGIACAYRKSSIHPLMVSLAMSPLRLPRSRVVCYSGLPVRRSRCSSLAMDAADIKAECMDRRRTFHGLAHMLLSDAYRFVWAPSFTSTVIDKAWWLRSPYVRIRRIPSYAQNETWMTFRLERWLFCLLKCSPRAMMF